MHQNIQSLSGKLLQLEAILNSNNVDILMLTEHWITKNAQMVSTFIPNYKIATYFCRSISIHGGCAILCRSNVSYNVVDVTEYSIEGVIECACLELFNVDVVVIVIYRPPNGDFFLFLELFCALLNKFNNTKHLVVGGDFNIDLLKNSNNKLYLTDLLALYSLRPTIFSPTRITPTTATCLDNFFVSEFLANFTIKNIDFNLSDHNAQIVKIKLVDRSTNENTPKYILKRNMCSENVNLFVRALSDEDWSTVFSQSCPERAFEMFSGTIVECFRAHFPLKRVKPKKNPAKHSACLMTDAILKLKEKVCMFADLSRKYPELKPVCRDLNQEYKSKLMENKLKFNDNRIGQSLNKNKTMWAIINEVKSKNSGNRDIIIMENGVALSDEEVANNFNVHFTTSHLNQNNNSKDYNFLDKNIPLFNPSFFLSPVNESIILTYIAKLKSTNSCGFDEISNTLLKSSRREIAKPLTFIINLCFEKGIFPEALKISKVLPLFKKGKKDCYDNYRAISLVSSFSKIIELAFLDQLQKFFFKNNLLLGTQHGFIKNKSVDTALVDFYSSIVAAIDRKKLSLGLFIDYSRAFDCVDYDLLLAKIFRYGVRGVALKFLSSYLHNRYQVVSVNNSLSSELALKAGVPQGSILGPFLYLIFANDLSLYIKSRNNVEIACYADDTNFLITNRYLPDLKTQAQNIYNDIIHWSDKNLLKLNKDKTVTLLFKQDKPESLQKDFPLADSVKILGIFFDSNLTWSVHIDALCEKVLRGCYGLRTLKNHCSRDSLITLYYSSIHCHLRYGILLWGTSSSSQRVFVLQKYALRILNNLAPRVSCRDSFKQLGILTITGLYIFEICCFVFKNKDIFLKNQLNHGYLTRFKGNLIPGQHSTALYQKSVIYMGCRIYNSLSDDIKGSNTLYLFKKRLKLLLIQKNCYSMNEFYL